MKVLRSEIPGVLILEPTMLADARGFFFESYNKRQLDEALGCDVAFVQENHSRSRRGVLRGLHYQAEPRAQAKLVRVTIGSVFDVAVDLRRGSPSYGRWVAVELSGDNHREMWVPAGFAHGFLVTSESADVLYKTTDYYAPEAERCVRWNDPELGIAWPDLGGAPCLSAKDASAPLLEEVRRREAAKEGGAR